MAKKVIKAIPIEREIIVLNKNEDLFFSDIKKE